MNDKMIQNASKMIEENLTGDGNDAPVIWLHGNARREMGKLYGRTFQSVPLNGACATLRPYYPGGAETPMVWAIPRDRKSVV